MIKEQLDTCFGYIAVTNSILSGDKPTLFFWPGLFFDGSMWDEVANKFADSHNILLIDPPGHGGSDGAPNNFTMDECANLTREILNHYKLTSCHFIGLSWGGFVAQAFLHNYEDMCKGVVLINTCSLPPSFQEKILFSILPVLIPKLGVKHFDKALIDALLSKTAIANNEVLYGKVRNQLHSLDFTRMRNVFRSVMKKRADLTSYLSGKSVKSLVICGEQDAAMTEPRTRHLISLLPANTPVVSLDVGHNAVLEKPEQVTSAIQKYLTS